MPVCNPATNLQNYPELIGLPARLHQFAFFTP